MLASELVAGDPPGPITSPSAAKLVVTDGLVSLVAIAEYANPLPPFAAAELDARPR